MNESDKNLIVKYITGQATDDEAALVKYLIATSTAHEEFYVLYYETWQKSLFYQNDLIDTDKAYSAFVENTFEAKQIRRHSFASSAWLAAASVLLICAFGIYLFVNRLQPESAAQARLQNEILVPKGSTIKTELPDGTKVWINAGSKLTFEEGFGNTSRIVNLDGEAYFDIAKNSLPFVVKTAHHTIRDIGTIFNVKAYSEDLQFETAVIEGEISVEGKLSLNSERPETVSVRQQQVLKLNYAPVAESGRTKRTPTDLIEAKVQKINSSQLEVYTGWTEDLLVFEGKTFLEISKIMERKYDVQIVMNDLKLRNYEYTGSFKNIDSIEKALQILKETTDIHYSKNGKIITIWGSEIQTTDGL